MWCEWNEKGVVGINPQIPQYVGEKGGGRIQANGEASLKMQSCLLLQVIHVES